MNDNRAVNAEVGTVEGALIRMQEVINEAVANGTAIVLVTDDDMVTIGNDPAEFVALLRDALEIARNDTPDGGREESGMMLS